MKYSANILKAYASYEKVMANNDTSNSCSDADYKRKMRNIDRSYDKFVKACEAEGLNHIRVNSDFITTNIPVSKV